jgi:hypothetical protein
LTRPGKLTEAKTVNKIKLVPRAGIPLLVAAVLGVAFGAPAAASGPYFDECSTGGYRVEVWAVADPGFYWSTVHYEFFGGGDESNINIRIYNDDNDLLWSWNSPDNREPGMTYSQPVRRSNGALIPAHSGDRADFTAIFDRPIWSDPRCTATAIVD